MKDKAFSTINLPVTITIEDIEMTINSRLKGVLFEDDSLDGKNGDGLMVKVEKGGDISINILNKIIMKH